MTRCDLRTHGECSCGPNECRVQDPIDLGTFPGTNNPTVIFAKTTRDLNLAFIALAAVVCAIIFGLAAQVGPVNV